MNSTNELLTRVKEAEQDYEWYPTTREILSVVAKDIGFELTGQREFSVLDIGAGNGSALYILEELLKLNEYTHMNKYAIEKSRVLIEALPSDIFVIGTDFHQQTLIDKEVDVIFCNPPYRQYDFWMQRIIAEANARYIYLVVPKRWRDNEEIVTAIKQRTERDVKSLGQFSFDDSEFRQARAQVEIVKVDLRPRNRWDAGLDGCNEDPFDLWFSQNFRIRADDKQVPEYEEKGTRAQQLHDLVVGQNIIERLEELYVRDFGELLDTYKTLEKFDPVLFRELGIDLKTVREGLKIKIKGLKNLYWQELFSNLDSITNRLTSKSRESLLEKLTRHTSVDYTADNAYAVVIWAVKNANQYFDDQLKEVYLELADQDNVRNYKSNKRIIDDNWRFNRKEETHYTLDYRLVLNRWSCFTPESWRSYEYPNGLSGKVHILLNDICTIGKNLGFDIVTNSMDIQWCPGELNEFKLSDGTLFMDVRAYKKGTIHIRCNQLFMKKLNIEAGRLNGWIKTPSGAAEEMGIKEAAELFGTNFKMKSIKLLAHAPDRDSDGRQSLF